MFVRTRRLKTGGVRYALVESYREGGKTRQRHLYYLGGFATPQERLDDLGRSIVAMRARAEEFRGAAAYWKRRAFRLLSARAAGCERRRRRLLAVLAGRGRRRKGKTDKRGRA
jgi:hypothetical protein